MRKSGTDKNDVFRGKAGDDYLSGNGGDDVLLGKGGDDVLIGGSGADAMKGGRGADLYVLKSADDLDSIIGFQAGIDTIMIDVPLGQEVPAETAYGSTLFYEGQSIIYEGGVIGAIKPGLMLSASDFLIS